MSKLILSDVAAGYNLQKINDNFDKIADTINNDVLFRRNPTGEPNSMVGSDLDMDNNRILNLPAPLSPNEPARLQDLEDVAAGTFLAENITFSPTANIHSTDVQHALEEVDTNWRTGVDGAKAYADSGDSSTLAAAKQYADAGDAATLAGAKSYADSGDAATLASAESYTDAKVAAATPADGSVTDAKVAADAAISASKLAFTQAGVGAMPRDVQTRMRDIISVKDFGAKGDGVSDDTLAVANALNYANGQTVYFPSGTYLVAERIGTNGKSVSMIGDGPYTSQILFTRTDDPINHQGFSFTQTSPKQFVRIQNIGICTATAFLEGKTAIYIDGSSQVAESSNPPQGTTAERSTKRVYINNVVVRGWTDETSTGWGVGVRINSLGWWHIDSYTFIGQFMASNDWQGFGTIISGGGVPVEMRMTNVWAYSAEAAILCCDYAEGLYVSNFDFVNVKYGIRAQPDGRFTTLPTNQCGILQATIGPGHVNFRVSGVFLANTNQTTIRQCNLYINKEVSDSSSGIYLLPAGNWNNVSNNIITKANSNSGSTNAIILDGSGTNVVSNNTIKGTDTGILASGTVAHCSFGGNLFDGCVNYGLLLQSGSNDNLAFYNKAANMGAVPAVTNQGTNNTVV